MRRSRTAAFIAAIIASVTIVLGNNVRLNPGQAQTASGELTVDDLRARLRVPDGYSESFQFLGSYAVAAGPGEDPGDLHTVFASPGTVRGYLDNGRFADGAVLVKEVFAATAEAMTTGHVSRAAELKGWFVMVKDGQGRIAADPLWGDGWGWAWFDAPSPTRTSTKDYRAECLGCHVPAQGTDWVYVRSYPPLR